MDATSVPGTPFIQYVSDIDCVDDPELRYTQSGAALAGFTVAISHRSKRVPSSVDPSGRATSTAKAEEQNSNGSSRTASQPSGSEDRGRSAGNGEWQDVNDGFFRCTAWRSVAENAAHTLKKGMRVFVAGKLVQRSWQDNDRNKRQSVEIQVSHVGPDLQFATATVEKATAEVVKSSADGSPTVSVSAG